MGGLKELRTRISSVKSTQKITSAMKMVAASRLRRSQILLTKSSAYYESLLILVNRIQKQILEIEQQTEKVFKRPEMLVGTGKEETYLLICVSADRGLCGGYNSSVAKETIRRIKELKAQKKEISVICIGRKARDVLRRKYSDLIIGVMEDVSKKGASYEETIGLALHSQILMKENHIDVCEVIYSRFQSAITREVLSEQVYPYQPEAVLEKDEEFVSSRIENAFYDYEPDLESLFEETVKLALRAKFFQVFAHSQASEHGARMTSMDSATRNAQDMLTKLTLRYNGIRQTAITTELTEIISGAEAI
ncbi:MAG: ATP synthase F1 subunit gamma [Alphaproteobacteria bacterium]|nr:ATP synthase F1 subunit gamma [Alphaproteobacteria bacterium]